MTVEPNNNKHTNFVESELLELLPHYESFFNRVGFKRIDGAVFGLLCFTKKALSSDEIETTLSLSQSAVSQSLKTLTQYSMIDCRDHKEIKRQKVHFAKEDALSIVSSILRKRELEYLNEFEKMSNQAIRVIGKNNTHDIRLKRMMSIKSTAVFAKSLCDIIINVNTEFENPYPIMERFPLFVSFVKKNVEVKDQVANSIKNKLTGFMSTIEGLGETR